MATTVPPHAEDAGGTSRLRRAAPAESPWLSDEEQAAWRALQRMQARLSATLNRQLSAEAGLSLQDYVVMVALTERPDGRMRPFELGRELGWEKSRLSHHISRMVERGLVTRERCPTDHRGWLIGMTPLGQRAIESAAPGHVAAVRRWFVERLTPAQLAVVAEVANSVLDGLAGESHTELH